MKNVTFSHFLNERIQKNASLFTKEELEYIEYHRKCVKKVYLLGFIDGRECYNKHS